MDDLGTGTLEPRGFGRRWEDSYIRDKVARQHRLFQIGQVLTSEMNLETLFEIIIDQTNQIMETERSTAFLYDSKRAQLWSFVATGIKRDEIRIPADYGLAGWVFQHMTPLRINDAYSDPRFYREVDKKSGFTTRNILCIPLINRSRQCVGAFQTLNKKSGEFTDDDLEIFTSLSYYVTIALENAKVYEEEKLLHKAKERIINHLSHELRTPLAILSSLLKRTSVKLEEAHVPGMENSMEMGQRNIKRLLRLQEEIDDILSGRSVEEGVVATKIIEDALSFVEEIKEGDEQHREIMDMVASRIEKVYNVEDLKYEMIPLHEFLTNHCEEARSQKKGRNLEILRDFGDSFVLHADRSILEKVFTGLLKNAIENTPDEGKIKVVVRELNDGIIIRIRDYGVGITPDNQMMVFGGFFHTQDTAEYSSKEPYAFNAGGSGSDLLRMKVLSERYGFSIHFNSTRCKFIPQDRDVCAGRISDCQYIKDKKECFVSGGSAFTVKFPAQFVFKQ